MATHTLIPVRSKVKTTIPPGEGRGNTGETEIKAGLRNIFLL
ncbi:hypothetical protein BOVA604_508 [Bacteroides ovatus]|nr:hypothetical protein BOVA604_508 [Bacteroides ovatus]